QQTRVDVAAHNIANVDTTSFKRDRITFGQLLYRSVAAGGNPVLPAGAPEPREGTGVQAVGLVKDVAPAALAVTGRALDVAVEGPGWLALAGPDGAPVYTRDGSLRVDASGRLVGGPGYPVEPEIRVTPGEAEVTVRPDGTVAGVGPGGRVAEFGRLRLYRFANPEALVPVGHNLYRPGPGAGPPEEGVPGAPGFGVLRSGSLETSNVDLLEEMAALIAARRAYQFGARALAVADEMWQLVHGLRR
ncbi:MAG: flagellar hook-basal body complex protein, partial [Firmicutes bacterium]|nr:flagellar hook-basal body complex protein [Bacillota bacterium]